MKESITKKRILLAPLDWGLGHTTRCIPLIRHFKNQGHDVVVAAEGIAAQLLKENFPEITIVELQGYRIDYSNSQWGFSLKILSQIPKILKAIKSEHQFLENYLSNHYFDLIVSDNRYGFFSSKVKSVILTHQVQILSGKGKLLDSILRKIHKKKLEKFDECWIVDGSEAPGLSGILGHPAQLPKNYKYIGYLSQFDNQKLQIGAAQPNHILILLSGPEPMRSMLALKLWKQCQKLTEYSFIFVSGNPNARPPDHIPAHIEWYSHLSQNKLFEAFENAEMVICRSGYTTLMDLMTLKRPALLIPTPGQTEQEYLAQHLSQSSNVFMMMPQNQLNLRLAIESFKRKKDTTYSFFKTQNNFREIIET
ncbi:MAG TPA: glycosyltransferase family protein [Edaphocola sp.]|nr:glycosyltransferase family protein [Edaphocola sp.]